MKEFRFELHITVYAETEDEARRAFCEDPAAWEIDEDDLTCRYIQDMCIKAVPYTNLTLPTNRKV